MPRYNKPYVREMLWGSVVKLYNYDMKGFRSHILWGKGCLLYRLEALMPEIALPIRMHECRDYGGKEEASFETTLAGLTVRLEEGKGVKMEEGFPSDIPFTVSSESMIARIYLLAKPKGEKGKADTYRTNEGVLFTINGQTHGAFPKSLFGRDKVNMNRLADSLLVAVDCSNISVGAREDLFMNSRDRLSNGELRKAVESEIQNIIGHHQGLRAIRTRRREEEISRRLSDSKPLEDILKSIFKSSPSLAAMFLTGQRLSSPFQKYGGNGTGNEGGGQELGEGKGQSDSPFSGKPYPTYFKFHNKRYGQTLLRNSEAGRRCRLKFDTDVENSYFRRSQQPGKYVVEILEGANGGMELSHSLTLHNGVASWSIEIPEELKVGHSITLQCHVYDEVNSEGFTNVARLTIISKSPHGKGKGIRTSRHKDKDNLSDGKGRDAYAGIEMPDIVRVTQNEWVEYEFDQYSGCKIIRDVDDKNGEERTICTFYVNVDNLYLKTEMKGRGTDPRIIEDKFVYGNVLLGLALVHDLNKTHETSQPADGLYQEIQKERLTIEDYVLHTTRAVAPFIIPMIDYLGSLPDDEAALLAQAGDED
jgi:hypothetical protein